MTRPRWPVLVGIACLAIVLAYLLHDVIYQLVIVPLAYALWLLRLYYLMIPQWVLWTLLIVVLLLIVLWNGLPEIRPPVRKEPARGRPKGEVETVADWIKNARRGNYFKWQLANRLGRIARRLEEISGPDGRQLSENQDVEKYLDAGMNYSFVDFLGPRSRLRRQSSTPLDADVWQVAEYLESQMENTSDRHR